MPPMLLTLTAVINLVINTVFGFSTIYLPEFCLSIRDGVQFIRT